MTQWEEQVKAYKARLDTARVDAMAKEKQQEMLEHTITEKNMELKTLSQKHDLYVKALSVLSKISDDAVTDSYRFIEDSLNEVLSKIFTNSPRKITIVEGMRGSKTPELSIELTAANGIKRRLKEDSGHGIRQLISLLCIMCLICITGTRRFLILDEVLTGLSKESRKAVNDILWSFTTVGFQFMIVEHGFIASGAKVYHLRLDNDVSGVVNEYISENGFFLDGVDYGLLEKREAAGVE